MKELECFAQVLELILTLGCSSAVVATRLAIARCRCQRCLADEPTRNVSVLCRSGLGSKIDTLQGFSALIYQLWGQLQ